MVYRVWSYSQILILITSMLLSEYQFVTERDLEEASNLTTWVRNSTARYILENYLALCPEQDMCLGPMFKRSFNFTEQPTCTPCECDDSCVRRSTCCPSKFYRQTDTPDFIEYQQIVNIKNNDMPLSCAKPLWNINVVQPSESESYWFVETCPNSVECLSPTSENISSSIPVTSLTTNQTYRNVYCALCNHEEISNLLFWKMKVLCLYRSDLLAIKEARILYQLVFSTASPCNVAFYPPIASQDLPQPCALYSYDVKCSRSSELDYVMKSYLTNACEKYYLPYRLDDKIYKNIYCALCEQKITDLEIQIDPERIRNTYIPATFSALIDFQQPPQETMKQTFNCAKSQIFDEKWNTCLDVVCEAEYMIRNQACHLIHEMIYENNYEINLIISPVDDSSLPSMGSYTLRVVKALQEVIKINNLENSLCRISVLVPSESYQNDIAVLIEISISYLHNINQIIEYLLNIFESYDQFEIPPVYSYESHINVSLTPVGQSFHVYGSSLFAEFKDRFYVHPMTGKEMKTYQSVSMVPNGIDIQRPHCSIPNMMSVVAHWYRCLRVKIKTANARLDVSNFSLCLVDYDVCFPSKYFKESLDKRSVELCLEQYLQAIKNDSKSPSNNLMPYLSLICLSLSSLGSVATISSFLVSGSYSRISDVNIILLAVNLILANTAHTLSSFFVRSETLCIGIGMLVHLYWLAVVCWMSLSFFQVFQTFTSFTISKVNVIPRVLFYLAVNLSICSSLVAINVVISYARSNGESLGYSLLTCYVADSDMILFTFALPVGLLICINIFMFTVTVFRISKRSNIRKSQDEKKIEAYFRLSSITGATWLLGFLAQFTGFQLLDILHTVLNGSQGLFLYLAFGLSLTTKYISKRFVKNSNNSTQTISQK